MGMKGGRDENESMKRLGENVIKRRQSETESESTFLRMCALSC